MKYLLIFILSIVITSFISFENIKISDLKKDNIEVNVSGAVNNPGAFTLPMYSTIGDLFEELSFYDDADLTPYNQNTILKDNDVLNISSEKEVVLISINKATKQELTSLPGIGEKTAEAIIEYRENSLFTTIDELMNVKGIGVNKYESIKDLISL